MNLTYSEMLSLADSGLRAAGINAKAAYETAHFLALHHMG